MKQVGEIIASGGKFVEKKTLDKNLDRKKKLQGEIKDKKGNEGKSGRGGMKLQVEKENIILGRKKEIKGENASGGK